MALRQADDRLSGALAGSVYAHNRGGQYVRQRVKPVNPSTQRQGVVRANLATLAQAYKGLTSAQRTGWEDYGISHPKANRLGEMKTLSGNACYNMLNARLLTAGSAKIDDAPGTAGPASLLTFSVARTTAVTVTCTYTATPLAAGLKLVLWMTTPTVGAVKPNRNQAFFAAASAAAAASPLVMTIPRTWAVGQTVTFYASIIDTTGQVSPELSSKVTA